MPAIEELKIKGFKAFPKEFKLNLKGKHLLLYGENGSGKSSIYYALHCLYQSPLKDDIGKKYFNKIDEHGNQNNQHLINLNIDRDDSKISLKFDSNHSFIYEVDRYGYKILPHDVDMRLPGHVEGVFINHKFIFNFFHFHNSEYINLFPVFEKDILPYCYVQANNLGKQYEKMINNIAKNGKRVNKQHHENIRIFNENLEAIINRINLEISDIYNNHFKDADCNNLRIKLYYGETTDHKVLNGYWLKYDYLRFLAYDNGNRTEKTNSYRSHNDPFIRLDVEEEVEPNTYRVIEKPQTYFNEAKLTAIALSIRFALLDRISPADGRFMALDDMLISLDMSNRTKVVDFLLSIADKYKIYLFTHDRAFFELAKEKIRFDSIDYKDNWIFKELYNNEVNTENPKMFDFDDSYTRAIKHFREFDYPATANYLRKAVEELFDSKTFPAYISKKDNGENHDKLRSKLDSAIQFKTQLDGNINNLQSIISALNTLLNPLSHRSIDANVYRPELKKVFDTIPLILSEMARLETKELIAQNNSVYFKIDEDATTSCVIEIELSEALYSYLDPAGKRQLSTTKGKSLTSITTKNGAKGNPMPHTYNKGTLEEICIQIHTLLNIDYNDNYIEFYYSKDNTKLSNLLL